MPIEKTYLVLDLETVIDVDNPPPPAPEGKEVGRSTWALTRARRRAR